MSTGLGVCVSVCVRVLSCLCSLGLVLRERRRSIESRWAEVDPGVIYVVGSQGKSVHPSTQTEGILSPLSVTVLEHRLMICFCRQDWLKQQELEKSTPCVANCS